MKISYNWLKKYISIEESAERIAQLLTDSGLEVEGLEKSEGVEGGLQGVVVGEVMACAQHPNADRLKVTQVNIGAEQTVQIVCGAPNVAAGQKVMVATVGTTLPMDGNPLKIKKGKLRGEASEGMICAEDELGVGKSHDGILVLPAETTVGVAAKDYFEITEDYTIEIGLTPNRADATSHIGVARDLVALKALHPELKIGRQIQWPNVEDFQVDHTHLSIDIQVEDSDRCPRYSGVTISDVKVQASPKWLQEHLQSIGLAPINNVVDITNFVLHEMGQPLHAFDAAKIKGNVVKIQTLAEETAFTTLDEKERKLSNQDLMICNGEEGMCIAGVFGGVHSGVTESTTSVFLESAYFNPVSVRKTAKRHGLNTDASFRYERGTDPEITVYALKRAALLIQSLAGGEVSMDVKDIYPHPIKPFEVNFSPKRCNQLIGKSIDHSTIQTILESLDIEVDSTAQETWKLRVPTYRVDVQREADVIEEVLRIYGYNQVELPQRMMSALSYSQKPDLTETRHQVSETLVGLGYQEIMNNSLSSSAAYENSPWNTSELVTMKNPLSSELNAMRQTLIFDGLKAVAFNLNRRAERIRFFELGKVYKSVAGKRKEREMLLLMASGKRNEESWGENHMLTSFYDIKGTVEALFSAWGLDQMRIEFAETSHEAFDYGLNISINRSVVGTIGKINATLAQRQDVKQDTFAAELDWEALFKWISKTKVKFQPISKYPAVRRDLALLLDKDVRYEDLERLAKKQEKKLLQTVNLFDVYEGKNLPENKKSYALSFVFQDDQSTLKDAKVDGIMKKIVSNFEKQFQAELR